MFFDISYQGGVLQNGYYFFLFDFGFGRVGFYVFLLQIFTAFRQPRPGFLANSRFFLFRSVSGIS